MNPIEVRATVVNYCVARGFKFDVAWAVAGMVVEDFDPDVSDEHGLRRLFEGAERLLMQYAPAG